MKWKEFFYLQKSDRQVILVLLSVILVAFTLLYILGEQKLSSSDSSLKTGQSPKATYNLADREGKITPELFPFDPNTADSSQLRRLGLSSWQVKNILRYRAKGGVYSQPSDFARLYGLTVKQYRMLEPYIRISPDYRPASTLFSQQEDYHRGSSQYRYKKSADFTVGEERHESSSKPAYRYSPKLSPGETIILNTADTTALKRVPGIGSYYARAILRYGQKLGGFCRVEQLLEISGFPEESLPYFTIQNPVVHQLNVNTSTLDELRKHPYCNFYQARAILDYRRLHGPLHSLADLKLLKEFPPEAIKQLEPYVCF
jgi:DNA uptake protein ComE-like DNA-binding protein